MSAVHSAAEPGMPLLLVVAPAARAVDGEAVRVARDVLGAAASVKLALPADLGELDRVITRRGRRRPVVIGDDRALHHVVRLLHRQSALGSGPIGLVPVGRGDSLTLARALGIPVRPEEAARAVLGGAERRLDLLADEDGGVVLGGLRIPGRAGGARPPAEDVPDGPGDASCSPEANTLSSWWTLLGRTALSVARAVTAPLPLGIGLPDGGRGLRIVADGRVLADVGRPVRQVAVGSPDRGRVEVMVRAPGPVRVQAREVTVSGADFEYLADYSLSGPVRSRTWTVLPEAWGLSVPG